MDELVGYGGPGPAPAGARIVGVLVVPGFPDTAGHPLAVIDGEAVVGREDDCDVVLAGARVSRRHARICVSGEVCRVEDLGSLNGTYVNRRRIPGVAALADGDRLTLADVELQFRVLPAAAAPRLPRGASVAVVSNPHGLTAPMPGAFDEPADEPAGDVRATHFVLALLACALGALLGHALGAGRPGALGLAVALPLVVSAVVLRASSRLFGIRVAAQALLVTVLAAALTVAGVTAAEVRVGHSLLPWVPAGGTFADAAQIDGLLGQVAPPAGCGEEPTIGVTSVPHGKTVSLRVAGRCFGPGSTVDIGVGRVVMTTVRADRYGSLVARVVVDPDASCPLDRCSVTARELQSLRYQQVHQGVVTAR
jgi:hypothetical protein